MKIFIDSAEIDQIKEAYSWGIVDGVTTNPSLIKKAVEKLKAKGDHVTIEDYICRILETAGDGPVSLDACGRFFDAGPAEEPRRAVVACLRVDLHAETFARPGAAITRVDGARPWLRPTPPRSRDAGAS